LPSLFVAAYPYEYLSTPDSTDHDVMQDTGCLPAIAAYAGILASLRARRWQAGLPATCPPLPEMLAFDLPGVPGDGRRVPAHKLNAVSGDGRRARRAGVKTGLSWHGIYFAFTLFFVNLIFYQRPHSPPFATWLWLAPAGKLAGKA